MCLVSLKVNREVVLISSTSLRSSTVRANLLLSGLIYSESRSIPENAKVEVDHSICLFWELRLLLSNLVCSRFKFSIVSDVLLGVSGLVSLV